MTNDIHHESKGLAQLLDLMSDGSENEISCSPLTATELLKDERSRITRSEVSFVAVRLSQL